MNKIKFSAAVVLVMVFLSLTSGSVLAQGPTPFEVQNLIRQLANGQITVGQLTNEEQSAVRQYFEATPPQITFHLTPETGVSPRVYLSEGVGTFAQKCNTVRAEAQVKIPLNLLNDLIHLGTHSQRVYWCYDSTEITTIGRSDPRVETAPFIQVGHIYRTETGGERQSSYRISSEAELRFCTNLSIGSGFLGWQVPCYTWDNPSLWLEVTSTGQAYSNSDGPVKSVGECQRYTGGFQLLSAEVTFEECVHRVLDMAPLLPKANQDGYARVRFWQGPNGVQNRWIAVNNERTVWTATDDGQWNWQRWSGPGL